MFSDFVFHFLLRTRWMNIRRREMAETLELNDKIFNVFQVVRTVTFGIL